MDAKTARPRPAGLFRRLAAVFYDSLLVLSVLIIATLLVLPFTGGKAIVHNPFYSSYLFLLVFFYFTWHWVKAGQTLGMRAWHLRLVGADGGPVTWRQAIFRFVAAIPAGLLCGLGYLWILINRQKLAWHDWASDTRVLVDKPPRGRPTGS